MSMFVQAMPPRDRTYAERLAALRQRLPERARDLLVLPVEILVEARATMRQLHQRYPFGSE